MTIYAFQELRDELLEKIKDLGILELVDKDSEASSLQANAEVSFAGERDYSQDYSQYIDNLGKLTFTKSYFENYNPIKKGFIDMFTGKRPELSTAALDRLITDYNIDHIFNIVKKHDERLREIAKEVSDIRSKREVLSPWAPLDIPASALGSTAETENELAVFPMAVLASALSRFNEMPVHYEIIWEEKSQVGVWLAAYSGEITLPSLIASLGGSLVRLPGYEDIPFSDPTVNQIISYLDEREACLVSEMQSIEEEDNKLAEELIPVMGLIDYYLDKKNLIEAGDRIAKTGFTLVIQGYARAKDVSYLKEAISEFKEVEMVDADPEPGEDVPIYLENHPLIRPIEIITNIFGYPKYDEIDPTPILAPFFWIFFGICLADAVYGLVLFIGCFIFLKKQKLADGGQKLVRLLMYSGVSTFFVGALMGSWLGDLPSVFFGGTVIEKMALAVAVLNPIEDPLTLLGLSILFGIFQIWIGIIVKAYSLIRNGQVAEGIWSQGAWVVFIPGLISWVLSKAGFLQSSIPFYVMATGALMVMYGASRAEKYFAQTIRRYLRAVFDYRIFFRYHVLCQVVGFGSCKRSYRSCCK